jgi:hypothetical protein
VVTGQQDRRDGDGCDGEAEVPLLHPHGYYWLLVNVGLIRIVYGLLGADHTLPYTK